LKLTLVQEYIPITDWIIAIVAAYCAAYQFIFYYELAERPGIATEADVITSLLGLLFLLEATRRTLGFPLLIIASVFLIYTWFGNSSFVPDMIRHKGQSLTKIANHQWLTTEGVFGIALNVSSSFVFLFVLFGSLLDKAGAGNYFIKLAFSILGHLRGGPAKAAVLSSGLTGIISGSSIANTVTTGTFTIPLMKRVGFSGAKAGAVEVSSSVNGQIMPPVMGAAAFLMVEYVNIPYTEVVKHAFIPAIISYIALLYMVHLEALKANMSALTKPINRTFKQSLLVYGITIIWCLMIERLSPGLSAYWATLFMVVILLTQKPLKTFFRKQGKIKAAFKEGFYNFFDGMVMGSRNMIGIAVATAAAGIIVGTVSLTGVGQVLTEVVEVLAGGSVILMLLYTAVICLILGMGLPTTANYIVVASLMAKVVVDLGAQNGLFVPLIAVHLFVFYFGIMADVTPPVDATVAILIFSSGLQGYLLTRNKLWESAVLILVSVTIFVPQIWFKILLPDYTQVDINKFEDQIEALEVADRMKITVRGTDFDDLNHEFTTFIPGRLEGDTAAERLKKFGLTTNGTKDERIVIGNVDFNSMAEKTGFDTMNMENFYITKVEAPSKPGFNPKLLFIPALIIFVFIAMIQSVRRRKETELSAV